MFLSWFRATTSVSFLRARPAKDKEVERIDMTKFDDEPLSENLVVELHEVATRVRGRTSGHAIDTGRDLIAIKDKLEHGYFTKWVENDCDIGLRTAENMMNAARWADAKSENVSLLGRLPMSAVYALAADDVPVEIESLIIADFLAGERPAVAAMKERIEAARTAVLEALAIADAMVDDLREVPVWRQRRALARVNTEILRGWEHAERQSLIREVMEMVDDPDAALAAE
jgi:hypothetical protein